jgi:hypothetical protein
MAQHETAMRIPSSVIFRYPRIASAFAFGIAAAILIYATWIPGPTGRIQGFPLALLAGLTHALAASITGRRVVHPARMPKLLHAGIWGGWTSFLALFFFSIVLTVQIETTNLSHSNPFPLFFLTFFFAFLGAGWALVLVSAGIGCGLHRLATVRQPEPEKTTV